MKNYKLMKWINIYYAILSLIVMIFDLIAGNYYKAFNECILIMWVIIATIWMYLYNSKLNSTPKDNKISPENPF